MPSDLGQLRNLKVLWLNGNALTGKRPFFVLYDQTYTAEFN